MIAIIDYGMGNLRSVSKALEYLGASCKLCRHGKELTHAQKVILPGVGAFGDAMLELKSRGFVAPIHNLVKKNAKFCTSLKVKHKNSI